jgi:hypothetical protein
MDPIEQSEGPAAPRPGWRRAITGHAGWVVYVAILWLEMVQLPAVVVPLDMLDPSWYMLLGHDWSEGLQAGKDYVFTYGPLGWLLAQPQAFQADLFATKVAAVCAAALAMALVLTAFVRLMPSRAGRIGAALLVLYLMPMLWDGQHLAAIVAGTALVLHRGGSSWRDLAVCLLLAATGLVKFTYLALGCVCALSMAVATFRRRSWRSAAAIACGYPAGVVVCWLLAGQSLGNLPLWLRRSSEIAAGYNETMGVPGPAPQLALGIACALLLAVLSVWLVLARPRALVPAATALACMAGTYVAWKAGYVRHDPGHPALFFGVTMLAPLMLVPLIGDKERGRPWLLAGNLAVIALSAAGMTDARFGTAISSLPVRVALNTVQRNAAELAALDAYVERQQETWNEAAVQLAMNQTRHAVGHGTIDAFGYQQGILFANHLRVRHRPVFQSYAAYTAALQELNAACYESSEGPEHVLFAMQQVEDFFPTVHDSQALLALLAGYQPVLPERDYLLLRRRQLIRTRADLPQQTVLERRAQMGEWVDIAGLPGSMHLLSLDADFSWRGRLRGFLLRAPELYLDVKAGTEELRYRIAPVLVRAPFLLDPLLRRTSDLLGLYGNNPPPRVSAFRIVTGAAGGYAGVVKVRVSACDGLRPSAGDMTAEAYARCFYPMFQAYPFRATAASPIETMLVDDKQVLFMHAPSEMRFRLGPGRHVLSGSFGILDGAWQGEVKTDGVGFRIAREAGTEQVEVFQRLLQPQQQAGDRGMQRFSVAVETQGESVLVFGCDCGPRHECACDWSYWTDIRIE